MSCVEPPFKHNCLPPLTEVQYVYNYDQKAQRISYLDKPHDIIFKDANVLLLVNTINFLVTEHTKSIVTSVHTLYTAGPVVLLELVYMYRIKVFKDH